jgi:TPR repeat protein
MGRGLNVMRVPALFFLGIVLATTCAHAEKRVALVVGNNSYTNLVPDQQLRRAVNDARAVGDALGKLGFEVLRGENLRRQALVDKLDELSRRLSPGDTALFFFAGHGVSIGGGNYILPTDVPDVQPGQETRLARASLGESDIVSDLQARGVKVAVVVLDACRNNPFKRPGTRAIGGERGFVRSDPVRGVFSLYSAGIGQTALDRLGEADTNPNSVFTRVLLPMLATPGLDLGALSVEVREEVARLASTIGHDQRPAYYDETIGGRVYLAGLPPANTGVSAPSAARPAIVPPVEVTECDRLAAPENWEIAGVSAVPLERIQRVPAIAACDAAMLRYPGVVRFIFLRGRIAGAAEDYGLARKLYEQSASLGSGSAMTNLGNLYRNGRGVAQDYAEARRWYEKGAAGGSATAMTNLGFLYKNGEGVARDDAEARRWYEKGAAGGDAAAMNNLGALYATGEGVARDDAEARRWYEKAAALGNALAMRNLGVLYDNGTGVAQDYAEARRWYEKAAALGNAAAMVALGALYNNGSGVARDDAEARRWYEKAAAVGNALAMKILGDLYFYGWGVTKDSTQARRWYEKGAAAGNDAARRRLEEMSTPPPGNQRRRSDRQ